MEIYKSKKKLAPLLNPGYAPVLCSKLLLTCLPSYRFWGPTLIDYGTPTKNSADTETTLPPPRMHILAYYRACLKKLWGTPSQIFGAPQRFAPPPHRKIPAGAHVQNPLNQTNTFHFVYVREMELTKKYDFKIVLNFEMDIC